MPFGGWRAIDVDFHLILNTTHTVMVFIAEDSKALRGPGVGELGPWPVAVASGMFELSSLFCPSLPVSAPWTSVVQRTSTQKQSCSHPKHFTVFKSWSHTRILPLTLLLSVTPQAPQELGVVSSLPAAAPNAGPQ